jgi:glycosyltransferase involved in cell wall biosynthesis
MYLNRYPEISPDACTVIPNGYDEEVFAHIDGSLKRPPAGPLRLVHAGVIYPDERDPRPFFRAVSRLKKDGALGSDKLRIELRASGSEALYCNLLRELEVDDVIHLLPTIPYRAALSDMASADGLVLLQAANCNHQIPAKVYEYLRIGRPILALTSHIGDTAALLKQTGGATIADLADEAAIYRALPQFIAATAGGTHSLPGEQEVRNFSRKKQTAVLAQRLSQVVRQTPDLEAASRPSKHIRVGERPLG